jgi:hypothetical protein
VLTWKSSVLWDVKLCSPLKINECLREHIASIFSVEDKSWKKSGMKQASGTALLTACFKPVSCFAYSLTLKMEVTCSSETSVDFHQTISQKVELFENETSACWHYCVNKNSLISKLTKVQNVLFLSDNSLQDTQYPCFSKMELKTLYRYRYAVK